MTRNLFTDDFKSAPYWWDVVPRAKHAAAALPAKAEIVVICSGFAGLMVRYYQWRDRQGMERTAGGSSRA